MKKIAFVLLLAAIAGCVPTANAQKITIGAKGGFSIPNLTGGGSENPLNSDYSSRLGIDYSIYGEYHFCPLFSVSAGLEYSSQGGQKNKMQAFPTPEALAQLLPPGTDYLYADYKSVAKINYLLVPVLARCTVALGATSPFSVYLAAGPFAGILLNAHHVTSGTSNIYLDAAGTTQVAGSAPFDYDENIKSQLHPLNFGIEGFLGISYKIAPKHSVFVEGGGNYGFVPIQKGNANGKNNTGAGTVTLGYAYTL
jgi:hypothetical protein